MEKRKLLAQMSFCRGLLYYFDMITDRENTQENTQMAGKE